MKNYTQELKSYYQPIKFSTPTAVLAANDFLATNYSAAVKINNNLANNKLATNKRNLFQQ